LKGFYEEINKSSQELEVVVVSGDRNEAGFKATMDGLPFVAVPFGEQRDSLASAVPCTGYPTPGVINSKTGQVIDPDVFGKVTLESLRAWIASV